MARIQGTLTFLPPNSRLESNTEEKEDKMEKKKKKKKTGGLTLGLVFVERKAGPIGR
jgi:hypothetical protein